jgi:pimeloyl-ACP methyl ester carboxylesterase
MDVQPFTINIPQSTLADLQQRLGLTRWPDEIAGSGWSHGADLNYMQEIVRHWQTRFDWRYQEKAINRFRQFRAEIQGLSIHFIHERADGPGPIPLLITHGWPGSFVEMLKIIPRLTDPVSYGGSAEDSFDVIVPSMPGYGFSDRATQEGMNAFRIAELWAQLMAGLGYKRFAAQGGDWGASVATCLGLLNSENVIGLHLNYIPGSFKPYLDPKSHGLSATETAFLKEQESWLQTEGGYAHVQATKPQTVAFGLNDSPVGLAAWIIEKFRGWSDCGGAVERRFTKDELLTNVMIYWVTQTIHSSMRLYYEGRRQPLHFKEGQSVQVPCAVARFPKEEPFPPREWIERGYNVQRWTEFTSGGHFAAMEEPELLVEDIRAFFRPFRRF